MKRRSTPDPWLSAALLLREAALAHDAVARLAEKTPYETRGRGGLVRGIALRDEGAFVAVHTGLFLDLTQVLDRSVEAITQDIRASMHQTWKEVEPHRDLAIHLDVVDLVFL